MTFEGIEGAGKSTQVRMLADRLRSAGYAVRITHEPGGTPLASAIRAILLHPDDSVQALGAAQLTASDESAEPVLPITELLLLSAARAQLVARMREWLAANAIVLCDRYADATRAYQGAGRGLPEPAIAAVEQLATGGLKPDLTFLLDLPVAAGLDRKRAQRHAQPGAPGVWNRLDAEDEAFHERVRAGYLALAAAEPRRWVVLDATLPTEKLAERIWQVTEERLAEMENARPNERRQAAADDVQSGD